MKVSFHFLFFLYCLKKVNSDNQIHELSLYHLPGSIFLDSNGEIYMADTSKNIIQKVAKPNNKISITAGVGIRISDLNNANNDFLNYEVFNTDEPTKSNLNEASSITFDSFNNMYIVDSYNNCIRKVDYKTKIITTIVTSFIFLFS
jgi:hypothetical protein